MILKVSNLDFPYIILLMSRPIKIDNDSIFVYPEYNGTWMDGADLALIKLPDNIEDEKEFCVMVYFREDDPQYFPCDIDNSTVKGMGGFPVSESALCKTLLIIFFQL